MTGEEVWLRAWVAVANTINGKEEACTRFADRCLRDFQARFPAQADTHPKGGDGEAQAPAPLSGTVPKGCAHPSEGAQSQGTTP